MSPRIKVYFNNFFAQMVAEVRGPRDDRLVLKQSLYHRITVILNHSFFVILGLKRIYKCRSGFWIVYDKIPTGSDMSLVFFHSMHFL